MPALVPGYHTGDKTMQGVIADTDTAEHRIIFEIGQPKMTSIRYHVKRSGIYN